MDRGCGPLSTAGLNDQLTFRTKPELASAMIERFLDVWHRADWVAGDEVYGGNPKLRAALEACGCSYVLAVACSAEVVTAAGKFRADALAKKLPKRAWQKLSAGIGAKGQRFYNWAVIDLTDDRPGQYQLLIRRNRTDQGYVEQVRHERDRRAPSCVSHRTAHRCWKNSSRPPGASMMVPRCGPCPTATTGRQG